MKKIVILGSTGSIGHSVMQVVREFPDEFEIVGLSAHSNIEKLREQVNEFKVQHTAVFDKEKYNAYKRSCENGMQSAQGIKGLIELAGLEDADIIVNGVVGSIGVLPTLEAVKAGKRIALANKESLVMAGEIIMNKLKEYDAELIPVDSEHNAIHQCLRSGEHKEVKKIILTSSGGPFRTRDRVTLKDATLEDALNHPTWKMGDKITIDSATLMNKGLELIEAYWLFNIPVDKLDVIIHPQSIVHSMVEFVDSSIICQVSSPDMCLPIQYAISYPKRIPSTFAEVNLAEVGTLSFEKPDLEKFPCLKIAFEALSSGNSIPCVLNAANEVAVHGFLQQKITFLDIHALISKTLDAHNEFKPREVEELVEADRWAREFVDHQITSMN